MKKLLAGLIILCLFTSLSIKSVSAQETAPKTKYLVWEIKASPSQMDQMIEAVQFQHNFLKEQNYPYAGVSQYTSDGYFWYSTEFQNFDELDKMDDIDKKLWESNPEKSKEIWGKFEGAFKSVGSFIIELQPELSILAEQSVEIPSGKSFRFFEKIYIKNGKMQEFTEIAKRYKALREKHTDNVPYYIYYPKFGPNMSVVYLIDEMGTNAAEHYTQNDAKWKAFGEEGQKLYQDFKPLVEKIETHNGWIDFDSSYFPSN